MISERRHKGNSKESELLTFESRFNFSAATTMLLIFKFFFSAVFLFPLTISIVLIGIPLAYMEVGLGHYTLQNVAHIWRMCPCAKGKKIVLNFE